MGREQISLEMDDSYGCSKDYCFTLMPLVSKSELAKVEDIWLRLRTKLFAPQFNECAY